MSRSEHLASEAAALREIAHRLEALHDSQTEPADPSTLAWWQQSHRALEEKLRLLREELAKEQQRCASFEAQAKALAANQGLSKDTLERLRLAEKRANEAEVKVAKLQKEYQELGLRVQESQKEVQRLAFQDLLTGLPNEHLLAQHMSRVFSQKGAGAILLLLDLDRFKVINDAFGIKAGDELLIKVAERLQHSLGQAGEVARRGEDEFMIFLSPAQTDGAQAMVHWAEVVATRLLEQFQTPFVVSGQKLFVSASLGASTYPGDAETPEQLLAHADTALYRAKRNGHPSFQLFTREISLQQTRSASLEQHIRYAVQAGELFLEYQPVVELVKTRSAATAKVVGAEALLRWNHRLEGLLQPGDFLPAAEESGAIVEIGRWIMREVCRQVATWRSHGVSLFACLNLSQRQLLQADLSEDLQGALAEFSLGPESLLLDVNEDFSALNVDRIDLALAQLSGLGFSVAIENYGVGFSSLVRLARAQMLKVAPALTTHCLSGDELGRAFQGAVSTAAGLSIPCVAVGVEDPKQARRVLELGCTFAQGYLFSAPVPAQQIAALTRGAGWKI